ncbi:hypothetical protein ACFLZ1_04250 [Patescibacteria group bacterium]
MLKETTQLLQPELKQAGLAQVLLPIINGLRQEGIYDPKRPLLMSGKIERESSPFIEQINQQQSKYQEDYGTDAWFDHSQPRSFVKQETSVLIKNWQDVEKGGEEEFKWTQKAIALAAVVLENWQQENGRTSFRLRDKQLLYSLLLTLGRGSYNLTELETDNRGVELPTGEGKTYAYAIMAAVTALKNEKVFICEPSYASAHDHFEEMGEFFARFIGKRDSLGLVSDRELKKDEMYFKPDEKGLLQPAVFKKGSEQIFTYNPNISSAQVAEKHEAYACSVVYTHSDVLSHHWLSQNKISSASQSKFMPELKDAVCLVTEGDKDLIEFTPWIISEKVSGNKMWMELIETCCPRELFPELEHKVRADFVKDVVFYLWNALDLVNSPDLSNEARGFFTLYNQEASKYGWEQVSSLKEVFKEGLGNDYWSLDSQFIISDSFQGKMRLLTSYFMFPIFFEHTLSKTDKDIFRRAYSKDRSSQTVDDLVAIRFYQNRVFELTDKWFSSSWKFIEEAARLRFTMEMGRDFIVSSEGKPILLSQFEFPLEKRQLQYYSQIFLQLVGYWQSWQEQAFPVAARSGDFSKTSMLEGIRDEKEGELSISSEVDRVVAPCLFNQFGTLRFGSGTLMPAAELFSDVYNAHVFHVNRSKPIEFPKKGSGTELIVKAPDGGPVKIDFFRTKGIKDKEIEKRVSDLHEAGRVALVITSGTGEVEVWQKKLAQAGIPEDKIKTVTAIDEERDPGTMVDAFRNVESGSVVITTKMSYRDMDLKLPDEVLKRGGAESIITCLMPTERDFWQASARALRGPEIPGSRWVVFSAEDLVNVRERDFVFQGRAGERSYQRYVERFDRFFARALVSQKGKEELFSLIKSYLHLKEEQVKNGMMALLVRDERMFMPPSISPENWPADIKKPQALRKLVNQKRLEVEQGIEEATKLEHSGGFVISQQGVVMPAKVGHGRQEKYKARIQLEDVWRRFLAQATDEYHAFLFRDEVRRAQGWDSVRVLWHIEIENLFNEFFS